MILTRSRLSLCCQCCHVLFCSVCFFLSGSDLSRNPIPEEDDYQVGGNNVIACSDVHWSQCPFGRPCCIVDGASYLLVAWLSCDKGMLKDFLKDLGWPHIWYILGDFSFSFWDSQNLTAGLNKSLSMLHFRVAADMPQMEWCIQKTQKKVKKRKQPIELASGCLLSQILCSWIRLHSWGRQVISPDLCCGSVLCAHRNQRHIGASRHPLGQKWGIRRTEVSNRSNSWFVFASCCSPNNTW